MFDYKTLTVITRGNGWIIIKIIRLEKWNNGLVPHCYEEQNNVEVLTFCNIIEHLSLKNLSFP